MNSKIKALRNETKKALIKAIISGKIDKKELKGDNLTKIIYLLSEKMPLIHIVMGELNTYTFMGNAISEIQYNELMKLSNLLDMPIIEVVSNWGQPIISNHEKDIDLK